MKKTNRKLHHSPPPEKTKRVVHHRAKKTLDELFTEACVKLAPPKRKTGTDEGKQRWIDFVDAQK